MTGYTVHTGSTVKFSAGWDQIFKNASKTTARARQAGPKKKARKAAVATKKKTKGGTLRKSR